MLLTEDPAVVAAEKMLDVTQKTAEEAILAAEKAYLSTISTTAQKLGLTVEKAAFELGVPRRTLYNRLARAGVPGWGRQTTPRKDCGA